MTSLGPGMNGPARVLAALVRAYQLLSRGRPSPCRFSPSCSGYAHKALEVHGARRGTWLALRRIARCHPFGGQGWDPVPERVPFPPTRDTMHKSPHSEQKVA